MDLPRHHQVAKKLVDMVAALAWIGQVRHDLVRILRPLDCLAWVSWLRASFAAGLLPKVDGVRLLVVAVLGGWLGTVLGEARSKLLALLRKTFVVVGNLGKSRLDLGEPCKGGAFVHETRHGHLQLAYTFK